MKRLLQISFVILLSITIISCSDSGTGPENGDNSDDNNSSGSLTGSVEVIISTSGNSQNGNDYTITVGEQERSVSVNDTTTIDELEEGSYEAELTNFSSSCSVEGDNPKSVDVNTDETSSVTFSVNCPTTGTVAVATSTSGDDLDDSYKVLLNSTTRNIGANETIFFSNLEENNYQVELSDIAENCAVDGDNPRDIQPTAGDTTGVGFGVNCTNEEESGGGPTLENKIVFQSNRDGDDEIFVMNADGSNQQKLTDNSSFDRYPVISNDGTQISFVSDRKSSRNYLFTMNSDGNNVQEVTGAYAFPGYHSWSPDDSKIVLTKYLGSANIYRVNTDGSNPIGLTGNSLTNTFPSWSPDGNRIAFASNRDGSGNSQIFTMDASTGENVTKLTDTNIDTHSPRWSPDGSRLVFTNPNGVIQVMDSNGNNVQQVTDDSTEDFFPAWSPDGSEIVFTRNGDIYKINADGSGSAVQLTDNIAKDFAPFWSPVE